MLNLEIESLKAQLRSKEDLVSLAILGGVETVREIVEKLEYLEPLYKFHLLCLPITKLSSGIVEYLLGTCPKSFNERDNKAPSTPVTRKKQVNFRVNDSTEASGSKPRSNTKKNRILPAKKEKRKSWECVLLNILNFYDMLIPSPLCLINQLSSDLSKGCTESCFGIGLRLFKTMTVGKISKLMNFYGKVNFHSRWPYSRLRGNVTLFLSVLFQTSITMSLFLDIRVSQISLKVVVAPIVHDNRFDAMMKSFSDIRYAVLTLPIQIMVALIKTVRFIRTDNGTEFVNQVISEYYEGVGIFHQKFVPRTPQQNGIAEAVATACYTQNRSLIHTHHNKTPYELVHDKKPDLTFFRVFSALCYPTNDSENLGKFQAKADIRIFMHQSMDPVCMSSGPEPFIMTPGQLKSGLAPTDKELEMLFQPMFDEHLEQSRVNEPVPSATKINAHVVPPGTSLSTMIAQDAPSTSASSSTSDIHHPVQHQEITKEPTHEDIPINHDVRHPSHNLVTGNPAYADADHAGCQDSKNKYRREVLSFLEIDCYWSSKKQRNNRQYQLPEANTSAP
ncbi:integrase, catalytic region, zinc finger, CCHC-type containing protein [Tanacetum coccineum]